MANGRFRRTAAIAGASLFLVSTTGFSQDTSVANPRTTGPGAVAPFDTTATATMSVPLAYDTAVAADSDRGFPWGLLGLLGLLGLFRRGGKPTVVSRDTYPSPPSGTRPRNAGTGTVVDDRTMNLTPRPGASDDPNRR